LQAPRNCVLVKLCYGYALEAISSFKTRPREILQKIQQCCHKPIQVVAESDNHQNWPEIGGTSP
ncbi:hypothetical protein, partial [Paenibacillus sp. FSL R7-269]|uniref:hypothetical protein n=1 Tax=Paenibacillus sp. FSL R7-269 TaxID=1226755 RepID=UPI001F40779E